MNKGYVVKRGLDHIGIKKLLDKYLEINVMLIIYQYIDSYIYIGIFVRNIKRVVNYLLFPALTIKKK